MILWVPQATWTKYLVSEIFSKNAKHRGTCTLRLNCHSFYLKFVSSGFFFKYTVFRITKRETINLIRPAMAFKKAKADSIVGSYK